MPKALWISVVDDDQFFRNSMTRLLRSLGYRVDAYASAVEFLTSVSLAEVGCLIADIHMPDMTGPELLQRLIDLGYATPTILVTGGSVDDALVSGLEAEVVCLLHKPVSVERLVQCLRRATRSGGAPEDKC
jgi:FixJ family two-component response regulator